MSEVYLTVQDVMPILRMSQAGVYLLVSQQKIPHFRLGSRIRFSLSDLQAWIAEQTSKAKHGNIRGAV